MTVTPLNRRVLRDAHIFHMDKLKFPSSGHVTVYARHVKLFASNQRSLRSPLQLALLCKIYNNLFLPLFYP